MEDHNPFTKKVENTICQAGFNPDRFGERPGYAARCVSDMLHDIAVMDGDHPELERDYTEAIKAIRASDTPAKQNRGQI